MWMTFLIMDFFFSNIIISMSIWLMGVILNIYKKYKEHLLEERLRKNLLSFRPEPVINMESSVDSEVEKRLVENDCIDLVRLDFLSFSGNPLVRKKSADIIRTYGVGTCGPRSFFGSTDMHKILEKKMSAFYRVDMCLVYSFGYLTTSSVIATYLSQTDVAFIDEICNTQIITGLQSTRCTVYTFRHNNPSDLNMLLENMRNLGKFKQHAGRFLIIEGICESTGDLCKLKEFLQITKTYKVRIILEESCSFGVLGATGRGITEYSHIPVEDIDVICGSLENAFGTVGGFSCGSHQAVKNQYMLSLGFVYSASLSVFLVQSILTALELMDDRPITLQLFAREVHDYLKDFSHEMEILSHFDSPIKVFVPKIDKAKLIGVQNEIVKIFIQKYKVYTKRNVCGICMHLNYNLFTNGEAKKIIYEALKHAAEIIRSYQ